MNFEEEQSNAIEKHTSQFDKFLAKTPKISPADAKKFDHDFKKIVTMRKLKKD